MARHLAFAIAVGIVTLSVWTHAAQPPQAETSAEDRAVLTAVIDHTIRPQVQKATGRPSPVLYLIDHTAPVCAKPGDPRRQPFCMFPLVEGRTIIDVAPPAADEVRHRADSDPVWEAVVPSVAHRAELFASFKERNTARRVLPLSEGPNVKLLAAPVIDTPSGPASPIYTVFSLPGYSSAGHAVVSGFIDCGEKCGDGLFMWLLEKRGGDWQVRGRDLVGFSRSFDPEVGNAVIFNGTEAIHRPPIAPLREPASR